MEIEGVEFDITASSNFKNNADIMSNGARFVDIEYTNSRRLLSLHFPYIPESEVIELDGDRNMKFIVRVNDNFSQLSEHNFYVRAQDYGQKSK